MTDRRTSVTIQEVSLRDGLQNEQIVLSPSVRADLACQLADAGISRIQIGSFVHPRLVPQMAGADEVWSAISPREGVRYSVLVLNRKGLDRAIHAQVPHVEIFVSASETHSKKNANSTVQEATEEACAMIRSAREHGLTVTAGVMCALGCFYEGPVPVEKVLDIVARFEELRPEEICLADTTGMGHPQGIRRLVTSLTETAYSGRLALHLHDTHGRGLANLEAALEVGVRNFDTSVGGLGGCPFVPGAKGNISTERTIEILNSMGYETGIDLPRVHRVRQTLQALLKRPLHDQSLS